MVVCRKKTFFLFILPPLFFEFPSHSTFRGVTTALKQQMIKEIRETQPKKSMNSRLGSGSPGEIRTLVGGSKARYAWPLHHRAALFLRLSYLVNAAFSLKLSPSKHVEYSRQKKNPTQQVGKNNRPFFEINSAARSWTRINPLCVCWWICVFR